MTGRISRFALVALHLLGSAGCSSEATDDADVSNGPLFLIQARTFTADETIGLLTPTSSLDGAIDYSLSLEQPGGGVLYAEEGVGTFMVGGGEAPTITRYELGTGNSLVRACSTSKAMRHPFATTSDRSRPWAASA